MLALAILAEFGFDLGHWAWTVVLVLNDSHLPRILLQGLRVYSHQARQEGLRLFVNPPFRSADNLWEHNTYPRRCLTPPRVWSSFYPYSRVPSCGT